MRRRTAYTLLLAAHGVIDPRTAGTTGTAGTASRPWSEMNTSRLDIAAAGRFEVDTSCDHLAQAALGHLVQSALALLGGTGLSLASNPGLVADPHLCLFPPLLTVKSMVAQLLFPVCLDSPVHYGARVVDLAHNLIADGLAMVNLIAGGLVLIDQLFQLPVVSFTACQL